MFKWLSKIFFKISPEIVKVEISKVKDLDRITLFYSDGEEESFVQHGTSWYTEKTLTDVGVFSYRLYKLFEQEKLRKKLKQ